LFKHLLLHNFLKNEKRNKRIFNSNFCLGGDWNSPFRTKEQSRSEKFSIQAMLKGRVSMTTEKTQYRCGKLSCRRLVCKSLGLVLLAGFAAVHADAQNAKRVVAPKAHPWVTSTTAKTESKISGTIQQISSQHGVTHFVIDGTNGAVTADLGPASGKAAKSFGPGDRVEIAGWMRTTNGKNTLVARQITAGGRQVVVRNQQGILVHPSTKSHTPVKSVAGGAR
jgi:hypothetical protein